MMSSAGPGVIVPLAGQRRLRVRGWDAPPGRADSAWPSWQHSRIVRMQTLTRQLQAAFDRSDRLVQQCEAFFEARGVWGRDADDRRPRLTVKIWTDWTGCVSRLEFAGLRAVSDDELRAVLLARPIDGGMPVRARHQPVSIGLRLVGAGWSPG